MTDKIVDLFVKLFKTREYDFVNKEYNVEENSTKILYRHGFKYAEVHVENDGYISILLSPIAYENDDGKDYYMPDRWWMDWMEADLDIIRDRMLNEFFPFLDLEDANANVD